MPVRERHGGAAGRARCRLRRIPGIERRTEHLVEGVGTRAELRRVRLGVDHGAVGLEVLDHEVGLRWDVVFEDRGALCVQDARDVGQVLDRQRQAREQPARAGGLLHQRLRAIPRPVKAQRRQRVDLAVDLLDALLHHVQQLERRNVAGAQLVDDGAGGFAD